jgi:putative membrane protein insertion efficiency factor
MKRVAMALIRFYRKYLSGLKAAPTCRFHPTCSAYALEAFEKRGFFAGLTLTLWRILRCSPLSPAGFDPVPEQGFKTMPLRWSKYDKYRAEQEAAVSPDTVSEPPEEDLPEDNA